MKILQFFKKPAICLLAMSLLLSTFAFATGTDDYITSDDPLVSLSYIEDVYTAEIEALIDSKLSGYTGGSGSLTEEEKQALIQEITSEVVSGLTASSEFTEALSKAVAEEVAKQAQSFGTSAGEFITLEIAMGQKLVANGSCEVILQSGSATVSGSHVYSVNQSQYLASGTAVTKNHLIKIDAADGSGIVGTWTATTVLVRGSFDIVE